MIVMVTPHSKVGWVAASAVAGEAASTIRLIFSVMFSAKVAVEVAAGFLMKCLVAAVAGMVVAFAKIHAMAGAAGPSALAGGIWTALLTTVFGLIIAIPSLAAYHWFEGRADRTARDMQYIVSVLDEWYGKTTFAPAGSGEPGFAESELEAVHF